MRTTRYVPRLLLYDSAICDEFLLILMKEISLVSILVDPNLARFILLSFTSVFTSLIIAIAVFDFKMNNSFKAAETC